jgi:phage gpG-like protein
MDFNTFEQKINEKMEEIRGFVREDVPDIIGVEAVNFFKDSFGKEGFAGNPWQEVERRKPESSWYGFSAGAKRNFSAAQATAKILSGETGELKEAITYRKDPGMVTVSNEKPYAAVHNYGLPAKIFGKKEFVMPKRTFMEHSDELQANIDEKIQREMTDILKK